MFYLKSLNLVNFRCYQSQKYDFSPSRNIVVGLNAVGKTSLVEAIHCLGFVKSFKNVKDIDLIKKNENYYFLKGLFVNEEDIDEVIVSYDTFDKRIKKNNKGYKSVSDYLGYFNTVVFSPDDLDLIKGAPTIRRKFIDLNLGQTDKEYLNSLIKYKKLLKERNEFLKNNDMQSYNKTFLEILTSSLIQESQIIIKHRRLFIDKLNSCVEGIANKLSGMNEQVKLEYKPNCSVDNIEKVAQERLNYDFISKVTTWGPSRDDININLNNELASIYSSQGQIRTTCLAIKLGLATLFRENNKKVIIVLDDVFSELDINRQNQLLRLLDINEQTFITTTSIDNLSEVAKKNSFIIEIKRGDNV